jgi:hypothetical protein
MSGAPMLTIVPVILAGGSGTRLWPLSRSLHPKQYLSLGVGNKDETLFQQAARRAASIADAGLAGQPPCIVAHEEQRCTHVERLRGGCAARILLAARPQHRAGAAARRARSVRAAATASIRSSSYARRPRDRRSRVHARCGRRCAATGGIVVLGIRPERPDTGYGYIRVEALRRAAGALASPASSRSPTARPPSATSDGGYAERRHLRAARERLAPGAGALPPRPRRGGGARSRRDARRLIPALRHRDSRDPRRQHRLRRDGAGEPRRLGNRDAHGAARCRLGDRRVGRGLAGRRA